MAASDSGTWRAAGEQALHVRALGDALVAYNEHDASTHLLSPAAGQVWQALRDAGQATTLEALADLLLGGAGTTENLGDDLESAKRRQAERSRDLEALGGLLVDLEHLGLCRRVTP